MKRFVSLTALIALFALILAACGGGTATQPTAAPPAPEATAAPPAGGMPIEGTVTLWHAYGTGSTEEVVINELVERARAAYPNATINVL